MIIGVSGNAGSGKDTIADYLVERHGFKKVAFADPMKRFCKEVFDFSDEQLWGASEKRNAPDPRYPWRELVHCDEYHAHHDPECITLQYLSPRHALQTLGTEWGRACYEDVWVDYALRVAQRLLDPEFHGPPRHVVSYTSAKGLIYGDYPITKGVVIPDLRFGNEIRAVRKAGGLLVRVRRSKLTGKAAEHASETEMESIHDSEFDASIDNSPGKLSLEDLYQRIDSIIAAWK